MKVALTGVTGHMGSAVVRELHARQHDIRILVRGNDDRSYRNIPVDVVVGDVMDHKSLDVLMQDCDALIHCAGVISIDGDPGGIVYKTNIEGTQHVIHSAKRSGIRRVIHISSIHAYHQQPTDEILDESRMPALGSAFAYDRSKKEGQRFALSMNQQGFEVLVMNPTSIIGPYDFKPSRIGRAIIDLFTGQLRFVIKGGFDFCDSRDVAHAIVNGLTMGSGGEAYLLSGTWYSLCELVRILSHVSGRDINVYTTPALLAWIGLPFMRLTGWITNKPPRYTNEALVAVLEGNKNISSAKAERDLGYHTRTLEETMRDTYHWFKESGYLG